MKKCFTLVTKPKVKMLKKVSALTLFIALIVLFVSFRSGVFSTLNQTEKASKSDSFQLSIPTGRIADSIHSGSTQKHLNRQITIEGFYMDDTESSKNARIFRVEDFESDSALESDN